MFGPGTHTHTQRTIVHTNTHTHTYIHTHTYTHTHVRTRPPFLTRCIRLDDDRLYFKEILKHLYLKADCRQERKMLVAFLICIFPSKITLTLD